MEMSSVSAPITKYLMAKAVRQKIPLSGIFELTPLCNMNCRMCYVRMNREEQEKIAPLGTVEQWLEVGKEARDSGMLYLLLTGGHRKCRNSKSISGGGFCLFIYEQKCGAR